MMVNPDHSLFTIICIKINKSSLKIKSTSSDYNGVTTLPTINDHKTGQNI